MRTLFILLLSTFFCFPALESRAQVSGTKGDIFATFTCSNVSIVTTKHDISNIVLRFADNSTQKFDNLRGKTGIYTGTGTNSGKVITGVWVKAGNNASGDCPGCGELLVSNAVCSETGEGSGNNDQDEVMDDEKNKRGNKKVKICHVPKGNPANAHTIIVSKKAAKAHINRHGGDYYGECKPKNGGGASKLKIDINCSTVNAKSNVNIETITLVLDNNAMQTVEINSQVGSASPSGIYEGYFIKAAYVQIQGGKKVSTVNGQTVKGEYYTNNCLAPTTGATEDEGDGENEVMECEKGNAIAKNIMYKVNGKSVSSLQGNVKEGNFVEITFTIPAGSEPTRYSLVVYNAEKGTYSEANAVGHEVFDYDTEEFGPGMHTISVNVPNNYFEVDFVKGCVIWKFGPTGSDNFYEKQNRLIARANGGEKDCCKKCDENKKVTICHVPKGNPGNAHTITISKAAAKAHINRHGGDYYGQCKATPPPADSNIETEFNCTSVKIVSSYDLSYVVLVFTDSTRQKFDNLTGKTGTFAGTGEYQGKTIAGVWAKGNDGSCSCGSYFENDNCEGSGGGNAEVEVTCEAVIVNSDVMIETVTLAFDDGSVQVHEINDNTAFVMPTEVYEGYFIMGAYVQLEGGTTVTMTEYGEEVYGDYYENPNFEECDELVDPALPVDLIKFEATKIEPSVVKLDWATASETNNDYIAIEKSSDIENWKEVCRVPSAAPGGNSQHVHDYSCYDHNADEDGQNIVYYRPKQVDLNGTFEYHNTIRLRLMDAAYATEIQSVYPNPATDRLNIRYNTAENGTFNIRLISLDGKSLLKNNFIAKPGVQTLDLDLMEDKLKPGLYVLEIQTEGEVFRQKVYKQ